MIIWSGEFDWRPLFLYRRMQFISVCGLHSWPEWHTVIVEWRRVCEVTDSKHLAAAGSGRPTMTGDSGGTDDAPQYLRQFTSVADIPTRQRLRSSTSDELCVPAVRMATVGRRAFSVADARVWNALPADVTSAPSLFTFRKRLKLHLFSLSYPGLVY